MANKMAAAYQFASVRCCGHSNLVIFNWISSKCQIWFASSLNMSFVGQTLTKMADKMAAAYQFASLRCCGHSYLVIFLRNSSNFHICIASITLWFKFEYEFVRPTIAKMGDKWLPPTSSHSWTSCLSHLLPNCFQISYMDYFYQTLTRV